MNNTPSNKFMAIYQIPQAVIANWMQTEPKARQEAEEKMKAEWQKWTEEHAGMIKVSAACGKTKRVTSSGIEDIKNDICLYTLVEAESHEAAAKAFANHPHLQIPQASIEVMAVRAM
jgi:hypothetical protein